MEDNSSVKTISKLVKFTFTITTLMTIINYGFVTIYDTDTMILVWGLSFFILAMYHNAKSMP